MATWDPADELNHPLDFLLVKNGFVTMFCQRTILDETVSWLRHSGYRVVYVDASSWRAPADMHHDIAEVLQFPGHYGSNLDSLNDCLADVAVQSYGWSDSDTGLVLVMMDTTNSRRGTRTRPIVSWTPMHGRQRMQRCSVTVSCASSEVQIHGFKSVR